MPRSAIISYHVELTKEKRLNQVSKKAIVQALQASHPEAAKKIPDTWLPKSKRSESAGLVNVV